MDLTKLKKSELQAMCEKKKMTKYLKKNKAELIALLEEAGVKNVVEEKGEEKSKAVAKPRSKSINKKLEEFIKYDDYKEALNKYDNVEDATDDNLYKLVENDIDSFIDSESISSEDMIKTVNKQNAVELIASYGLKKLLAKCKKESADEMYKELFIFYYNNNKKTLSNLVYNKLRKEIVKNNKPKKEAGKTAAPKSKTKLTKKSKKSETEEEPEEETEEEDVINSGEESEYEE